MTQDIPMTDAELKTIPCHHCGAAVLASAPSPAGAVEPVAALDRIRVAQDSDGFWTCREAVSGSQEYVRADLAAPQAVAPTEVGELVAKALAEVDSLERYGNATSRAIRPALTAISEKLAEVEQYARKATATLTDLVGGGSECFAGRIGEMYVAELPYCKKRIRDREAKSHEHLLKAVQGKHAAEATVSDLRAIISDSAKALGNGAHIDPSCSVEFMRNLPEEIRIVVSDLRRLLSEASEHINRYADTAAEHDLVARIDALTCDGAEHD